jgi:phosphoribosylformimino-5-aminoimidazole carboxamide ribotide isomerase
VKIFPAIDIQDGKCVRLRRGNFNEKDIFSDFPEEMARRWESAGAEYLHLVDLDGALQGKPVNRNVVKSIVDGVAIPVQAGGGFRDLTSVREYFEMGVARIVLGTSLISNFDFLRRCAEDYPGRIIAGIDARKGRIAIRGWTDDTGESAVEYASRIGQCGVAAVVFTDIERDGMMSGPDFDRVGEMASALKVPLIVSGGVTSLEDIRQLGRFGNIEGIIVGRALYQGSLDLGEAIMAARGAGC